MILLETAKDIAGYENRYAMALYNLGGGGNPPRNGLVRNQYYAGKILNQNRFHVLSPDRMCYTSEFLSYRLVSIDWTELTKLEQSILIKAYGQNKLPLANLPGELTSEVCEFIIKKLNTAGYIRWTDEFEVLELTELGKIEVGDRLCNLTMSKEPTQASGGITLHHHSLHEHHIELPHSSTLQIRFAGMEVRIQTYLNQSASLLIDPGPLNKIQVDTISPDVDTSQIGIKPVESTAICGIGDNLMSNEPIYITATDKERLHQLFSDPLLMEQKRYLHKLKAELERATIVPSEEIPADVITMNSKFRLIDVNTDEEMILTLVYPDNANIGQGRISVLAPVGTAILGYRTGEIVEWEVPDGIQLLRIESILYQPEAVGEYSL